MLGESVDVVATLVDDLDEGIWLLDPQTSVVLDVSLSGARSLGQDVSVVRGRRFAELSVPPLGEADWASMVAEVPAHGCHRLTLSLRHADGSIVPSELRLTRRDLTATDAGSDAVVVVSNDITEQVRLAERLRNRNEVLARLAAAVDEGVALVDRHGRIEELDERFCELVDLPAHQLVDRSIFDPPWRVSTTDGAPLAPEDAPGTRTLRSGRAVRGVTVRLSGSGRRRAIGDELVAVAAAEPILDPTGTVDGAVLTLADRSTEADLERRVERLTHTDALTGLASRHRITELLAEALDDAPTGRRVGVLQVDLDRFRSINDTFGTAVGDRVLAEVGARLADLDERHVAVGRLTGDQFLVVTLGDGPSLTFDTRLRRLAEEVQRRCERVLEVDELELRVTATVGVARSPGDGTNPATVTRSADQALAAARSDGRQRVRFYERSMDERARTGLALDRDLRRAAAQRELEVHYQPIIDLRSGRVASAEALVRWNHPQRGPIPPSVFIPTAEATGSISAISDAVIATVAADLAAWNDERLLPAGSRVAVNISAAEFARRGFVERLASALAETGVAPTQVELEITETLLMNDIETTAERLRALDRLGFVVALDDFGTGYSSLSYLHSLPLHTLKVDRSFVSALSDGRSETITRAILSLAHGLGIVAIGEGVETDEQLRFLTAEGCDRVQGYLYAPPLPRAAFERFVRERHSADVAPVDLRSG